MKLFNKKEEKRNVGRPKLADDETKKKAIILVCLSFVLVITLALTGLFKLNIIKFNRLKAVANTSLCTEIPAELQPGGKHDYGFTDPKFYSAVLSSGSVGNTWNHPYDNQTYCSTITEEQLQGINYLYINNYNIENVDGIEYLMGLDSLELSNINLTDIDLKYNANLKSLNLMNNDLSKIDLSNNNHIATLYLKGNHNLKSVNLSGNTALTSFAWHANNGDIGDSEGLNDLNLSGMTSLKQINIHDSDLETLDLSNNNALENVYLKGNTSLTNLNLNQKLTSLYLIENDFNSVNLSNNQALKFLELEEKKLDGLDLSSNQELERLNLKGLKLNNLDLHNNVKLKNLYLSEVSFNDLDLTNNKTLASVNLNSSEIGKLNLSNLNSIKEFEVGGNSIIDEADLSGTTSLEHVYLESGSIDKLDMSETTTFKSFWSDLSITKFKLGEANFSGSSVERLKFDNIGLRKLNISNIPLLRSVSVSNNNLSEIIVNNVPNLKIFDANNNNITNINIENVPLLGRISLVNNKLEKVNLDNLPSLEELDLSNNNLNGMLDLSEFSNLTNIQINNNKLNDITLPDNNILNGLILSNNNLTGTFDLSKYNNLYGIYLDNNNFDDVILGNNEVLEELLLHNNNLKKIDLSNVPNLNVFTIEGNPMTNTIYLIKNKTLNYNKDIMLNENRKPTYAVNDNSLVLYENEMLKALKEGITKINMTNDNFSSYSIEYVDKCAYNYDNNQEYCDNVSDEDIMLPYFLSQEIKVYDILSDVYKIDKDKKTIDASGLDLDISQIKLTLEGLSSSVKDDNFIIKDRETIVDTYKILNMKKVVDKPSNSGNANNTNNVTTTKKSGSNSKTTTKQKTTTTEDLSDIEINGTFVSVLALQTIKNKDRNIVVKNEGITVTINGKDIEKMEGNLDLSYELKVLKESIIYNEVKDKVTSGMVLSFKSNNNLPGKTLISMDVTDTIKKNIGTRNLRLYSYKNGKLTLVAENINPKDKKLNFYVKELGSYILTDKELTGKSVKEDTKLLESNNKINKGISFRCMLWLLLILIILGIIGYVIYKKNKDKNKDN